jgi:NitT/TauT family transport system substrate-binding protein
MVRSWPTLVRVLACLLVASIPAQTLAQSAPEPLPIRIANLGFTDASALPIYAQQAGFFKKYGLDATITTFNGGGAIIAAIAGGSLDAGFSNITSAVAAIQRGIPIVILTAANITETGRADALLMKARGSKLKTGADLTGKVIAVTTLGGTLQLGAEQWIDKNGGDSKSVHFVEIPTSNMSAALKQGRIDAAMISEPFLTQESADIEVLADAFSAVAPAWISSVFVASKAWVSANPDGTRRFIAAMHETGRWANAHHADTAKILAPLSGVPLSTFTAMTRTSYTDVFSKALLQPGIDAAAHYGALKAPFDTADIVAGIAPYVK